MKNYQKKRPPNWATKFLSSFCGDYYIDEIKGDLEEIFHKRNSRVGYFRASILYIIDVLRFFFKPYVRNNSNGTSVHNIGAIISNYSKIGLRQIARHKVFTIINVIGLSTGLSCSILIALYAYDEMSYDTFFKGADNIYRVAVHIESSRNKLAYAVSHPGLSSQLVDNYPEIETATQVHKLYFHPEITVVAEGRSFVETKLFLADSNFFDVFSIKLIEGNKEEIFTTKNHVVLSKSTAQKYFGDVSPIGKVLKMDYGRELTIAGVMEDLPKNSHFEFEILASMGFMQYIQSALDRPNWAGMLVCTYIKTKDQTNPQVLSQKFSNLIEVHGREQINARYGDGASYELVLQPLKSIHLESHLDGEMAVNGNQNHVWMLIALCMLIVLVSCINFTNLSSAQFSQRVKEVAIRKVLGSVNSRTIVQFLIEAILVSAIGMWVAILMVIVILPGFNGYINRSLDIGILFQPYVAGLLLIVTVFIGIVSGSYPATMLSGIKTSVALKGSFKTSKAGLKFRNLLVTFQFIISIGLISATMIIAEQLNYLNSKPLGYNKSQTLVIHHPLAMGQDYTLHGNNKLTKEQIIQRTHTKLEIFKTQLNDLYSIESVGSTFQMMGSRITATHFVTDDPELDINAHFQTVDNEFLQTMDIELVRGRMFSDAFNEEHSMIINETTMRQLGWNDPIGRNITMQSNDPTKYKVIGVVKDYHFQSLHEPIGPLLIISGEHSPTYVPTVIVLRVKPQNISQLINQLEIAWNSVSADESLSFTFLNEDLKNLYATEQTSMSVIKFFAMLAIFIAVIGLFGLVSYDTQQRNKEIGIRKVLGGSILSISYMISLRFLKLIVIAFLITLIPTYFFASEWLNNFAFHVQIGLWPFFVSLAIAIILVILTAGFKSFSAALANPVESLRDE